MQEAAAEKEAVQSAPDAALAAEMAADAEARYDELRLAVKTQVEATIALVKAAVKGEAHEVGDDEEDGVDAEEE